MTITRGLGVCYYPEQWSPDIWREDARRMAELGLGWVRIGEFSWARIEPKPGQLDWQWLDDIIDILGDAGLKVVLGTPTATPPRWMIDRHPDMIAVDQDGQPRKFGSRRHYCFSHAGYHAESARIVELFAERYGRNPHVAAWQTDNEYGCHDTVISYSDAARQAFRIWCRERYETIENLNDKWGNIFWSMAYNDFDQIDLPNLTVTEPNPSHVMAFRRFSSDQVVKYNRMQVEIIKRFSDLPIAHNYMGRITEFDHFKVGDDLEIASWDSYPLGFLEDRIPESDAFKHAHARQGHPDFQAFHHDIYRAVGKGRWWVMEQQPGPVNWAPYNPAPLPGMVRLWTWEAFAHGAENVVYFRWRQAPFAQEQMHSGLLRPDSEHAPAFAEAKKVAAELKALKTDAHANAPIALVFDYESAWATDTQPQGAGADYFDLVFDYYRAARKLGLSLDIVRPDVSDLSGYKIVMLPGLMHVGDALKSALEKFEGAVVAGPRTNAKTEELTIPLPLSPNLGKLDAIIEYVESLRPTEKIALDRRGYFIKWREQVATKADVSAKTLDGQPAVISAENWHYVAGWGDQEALMHIIKNVCDTQNVATELMPKSLRRRDTANHQFYFNYGQEPVRLDGREIEPAGVFWRAIGDAN
jgi:beta-galactosidase